MCEELVGELVVRLAQGRSGQVEPSQRMKREEGIEIDLIESVSRFWFRSMQNGGRVVNGRPGEGRRGLDHLVCCTLLGAGM